MIEEDKPSFWDKVVAFVLAVLGFGVAVTVVQLGIVGVLQICR